MYAHFLGFLTLQLRKYHLRQFWLCTVILNLYPCGRQFKVQCAIETTLWVTPGTRRSLSGEDLRLTHMEIVSKGEARGESEKRTTELKGKQKKLSQRSPIKLIDDFPGGLFPRCMAVCAHVFKVWCFWMLVKYNKLNWGMNWYNWAYHIFLAFFHLTYQFDWGTTTHKSVCWIYYTMWYWKQVGEGPDIECWREVSGKSKCHQKEVRATVVWLQNNIFMCSENTYNGTSFVSVIKLWISFIFLRIKKPSAWVLAFDCN